ncbi:MAG: flagellar FlbD family protein [Ferrimicrobium sp.]
MIELTRLSGSTVTLNSDLIERVEATPDTVVTLVSGACYVVRESVEEVVKRVTIFKALVFAPLVDRGGARSVGPPMLHAVERGD